MPRRIPSRAQTEAQRQAALDVAWDLLGNGPGAVTVARVAARLPVGEAWVRAYLGNRRELLRALIDREAGRLAQELEGVAGAHRPPRTRLRAVLELLVPRQQHRAGLWMLSLLQRHGYAARVAEALGRALGPDLAAYHPALAGGLVGALLQAVEGLWTPSREELLRTVQEMGVAVLLFRDAATRRGGGASKIGPPI